MGLAQYSIIQTGENAWGVLHDGNVEGDYATKEAAFEAVATAASLSLREGHEIRIHVPAVIQSQNTLGSEAP
jgi:hypothetical protein